MVAAGDFPAASLVFRSALQRIRTVAQQTAEPQAPAFQTAWKLGNIVLAACEQDEVQSSCASFNRGFTIGAVQDEENHMQPDNELLVATLLYNTALAYDLRRKKNQSNRLGSIQRACSIYEQTLSVLQMMSIQNEDTRLLILSSANNRAALALEMCDYDMFDAYRSFLEQLIRPTEVFDYNFFACNVLTTDAVRERPAPAA